MSAERTHGRDSAVDDAVEPHRELLGPCGASLHGHRVELWFENARYAEIFYEIHRCKPLNALMPEFAAYAHGGPPPTGDVAQFCAQRADELRAHAEASFYPEACKEYRAKEAAYREVVAFLAKAAGV